MIILGFVAICILCYWAGGQGEKWWGNTHVRDIGCTLCIYGLAWYLFGWSWWYILGAAVTFAGMTIGDHGPAYWSVHGFVIALGMVVLGFWLGILVALLSSVFTYLVSRYLNRWGFDVILRGLIYTTLPVWFTLV